MSDIVIVEYQLGNLFSIENACKKIGMETKLSSNEDEIMNARALILPGVGAFGDAMKALKEKGLDRVIKNFAATGKPVMGICLGMHLLFDKGYEFGENEGLGIINGSVRKFPAEFEEKRMKIPHMGWNQIYNMNESKWKETPLDETKQCEFMYFVHSFYVDPKDEDVVLTKTNYSGFEYCSSVKMDNIFATQFHPEKSGEYGLQILKGWKEFVYRD